MRVLSQPRHWRPSSGTETTPEEVFRRALRYRDFWGKRGGITVSGGEPLLQKEFVSELFALAKAEGVHTAIDTSGYPYSRDEAWLAGLEKLLSSTSLVLLDIKHIDPERHRRLTGKPLAPILDFARHLDREGIPMWIRHVLVPGWTDGEEDLQCLSSFIGTLRCVERVEVLPYHDLGRYKWDSLGIPYRLSETMPPDDAQVERARRILVAIPC